MGVSGGGVYGGVYGGVVVRRDIFGGFVAPTSTNHNTASRTTVRIMPINIEKAFIFCLRVISP
jgi:hypothetical protein